MGRLVKYVPVAALPMHLVNTSRLVMARRVDALSLAHDIPSMLCVSLARGLPCIFGALAYSVRRCLKKHA